MAVAVCFYWKLPAGIQSGDGGGDGHGSMMASKQNIRGYCYFLNIYCCNLHTAISLFFR